MHVSMIDLLEQTRSTRRFKQKAAVSTALLEELIAGARLSASAGNLQPLRYVVCNDVRKNKEIFATLGWAVYLAHWKGPAEGERPAAYIVITVDDDVAANTDVAHIDVGIAAQSMLLLAREKGLGGCLLGSFHKEKLEAAVGAGAVLPGNCRPVLVLALGEPAETCVIETVEQGDVKYWRDEDGVHHTPKRSLQELILAHF